MSNFASAKQFIKNGIDTKQESISGGGSTMASTVAFRYFLPKYIKQYGIESILDIGCGDWHWMSTIREEFPDVDYEGWDASEDMIGPMTEKYGTENTRFEVKDIIENKYPKVDLVIARDVLFHLKEDYLKKVLKNISKAGVKYLLATTFPGLPKNEELTPKKYEGWGFRPINLDIEPYNMKDSVITEFKETTAPNRGYYRHVYLYEVK